MDKHSHNLAEVGTDMISRQAAIDFVENQSVWVSYTQGDWDKAKAAGDETEFVEDIIRQTKKAIQSMIQLDLPAAQPMRKKGRWKRRLVDGGFNADWYCSECGWKTALEEHGYNYCPNCGADCRRRTDDKTNKGSSC